MRAVEESYPEVRPTARLTLFRDRAVALSADGSWIDEEVALAALAFDYDGFSVDAGAPSSGVFLAGAAESGSGDRCPAGESAIRRTLETFGMVDLECLDHIAVSPGSSASYLVRYEGDVHDLCDFESRIVPELEAHGIDVTFDDDYPWRVAERDPRFYATIGAAGERPDWFALELGVEVQGQNVNLVPALLALLSSEHGQSFRALRRRPLREVALPIGPGRYVTVPKEKLAAILEVVVELHQGTPGQREEIYFGDLSMHAVERLGPAMGGGVRRVGRAASRLRVAPEEVVPVDPPKGLNAVLRPYQAEGLAWLQSLTRRGVGGILADDMGLGKTLQTIAHLLTEKLSGRMDRPSLVVAPTSLVGTWQREIARFAPSLKTLVVHGPRRRSAYGSIPEADVVITTYPIIVRDEERFESSAFHLLILDEAHSIKNSRSHAHRVVGSLESRHRLCLTGTPMENHLGELWSLFDFLNPGMLSDELAFRRWYRKPIEEHGDETRLAALKSQVSPFLLRREKAQVATDLPPKTLVRAPVELDGRQRELYESIRVAAHRDVRKAIRERGIRGSTISILDALMKLRQVCCDPRLCRMDAARAVHASAKTDAFFSLVERQLAGGHRVLVFSQFTSMLALLSRGLKERRVKHLALTGSTRKRQSVVDAFEGGEADVFLISLKAGGCGLTLTSADTVIHYDQWWNPAAQDQATDRAYRIGQDKPVFVHELYVAGSVEERMLELQARKRRLADALLRDGPRAPLGEQEVEYLFAPLSV